MTIDDLRIETPRLVLRPPRAQDLDPLPAAVLGDLEVAVRSQHELSPPADRQRAHAREDSALDELLTVVECEDRVASQLVALVRPHPGGDVRRRLGRDVGEWEGGERQHQRG